MIGLQEEWIQKRICPRYFNRGVCVRAGKDFMARKFKALRPTLAGRYWLASTDTRGRHCRHPVSSLALATL